MRAETLHNHPYLRVSSPDPLHLLSMLLSVNPLEPFKPKTYEQAISNAYAMMEWGVAMGEEYNSLIGNGTWELVYLPPRRKSLKDL